MAIRQYFQALKVVQPATIVSLLTIGVNVGLNQIFVFGVSEWTGLGLRGSPLATFFSMLFQPEFLLEQLPAKMSAHNTTLSGSCFDVDPALGLVVAAVLIAVAPRPPNARTPARGLVAVATPRPKAHLPAV